VIDTHVHADHYSGKPSSTLGFEKHWNAALTMNKAAFVEYLAREIPPRPANMEAMVQANLGIRH